MTNRGVSKGKRPSFKVAGSEAFLRHASGGKLRELYQNAKKVKKYKKLMKHMHGQNPSVQNPNVAVVDVDKQNSDQNELLGDTFRSYQIEHVRDGTPTKRNRVMPDFRAKHLSDSNKLLGDTFRSYQTEDVKDSTSTKRHRVMPDFRAKHSSDSKKGKGMTSLERLRQEYEKERAEREKARKEEEAALASQKEARERAKKTRKDMQLKMRKKTSTGQPVMKHRLQYLLEKIQQT